MYYESALQLLLRLEMVGMSEADVRKVVKQKFSYVVTAQVSKGAHVCYVYICVCE